MVNTGSSLPTILLGNRAVSFIFVTIAVVTFADDFAGDLVVNTQARYRKMTW